MVDKYVETTGNEVDLDVTPFAGMLDKTRNALQSDESEYDALAITEQNISFFYNSGLLARSPTSTRTMSSDPI